MANMISRERKRRDEAMKRARGTTQRKPTKKKATKKTTAKRTVKQPKSTPAQKVPSISGGTGARAKRMSDIQKRIDALTKKKK